MNSNKNKILITGGLGAIGFNLIKKLKEDGNNQIHILDNYSSGGFNESTNIDLTYLDISNQEKVKSFCNSYKPNYIYHLAAHFANQNSVDFPISDIQTNVIGLVNILEEQKLNSELIKIVYASSSCVYGNLEQMEECIQVNPYDTPYAINKYVGELYSKYYAEIHKLPIVCARIFNSYGPGEMPGKYRNVIPNFILKALNNEDIIITGTGNETRDFTYVSDTIELLSKIALSKYKDADIFNGGTGIKTKIQFIAELIIKLSNSNSKIIYKPARNWDHVKDRCSNISKSSNLLGYEPKVNFENGLLETINWIKEKINKNK